MKGKLKPEPQIRITLTELVHLAVKHCKYKPPYAWSLTLPELMLALTPCEDTSVTASDPVGWRLLVEEIRERNAIRSELTYRERIELEEYIMNHTT